jgi:hypothetical protein
MAEEETELVAVETNINRARQIVGRQKQLIADLEKAGVDTLGARQMLEVYETNLRILEGYRDYVRKRPEKS